jgi:hypothetical protein
MQLATIRKKKKQLTQSLRWFDLSGIERKEYKTLCAKERETLLKHPLLPQREVTQNDNSPKYMDSR